MLKPVAVMFNDYWFLPWEHFLPCRVDFFVCLFVPVMFCLGEENGFHFSAYLTSVSGVMIGKVYNFGWVVDTSRLVWSSDFSLESWRGCDLFFFVLGSWRGKSRWVVSDFPKSFPSGVKCGKVGFMPGKGFGKFGLEWKLKRVWWLWVNRLSCDPWIYFDICSSANWGNMLYYDSEATIFTINHFEIISTKLSSSENPLQKQKLKNAPRLLFIAP